MRITSNWYLGYPDLGTSQNASKSNRMWVPVFCAAKGTRTTPDTLSKSHVPAGFWSNSLVAALLATETTPEHGFFFVVDPCVCHSEPGLAQCERALQSDRDARVGVLPHGPFDVGRPGVVGVVGRVCKERPARFAVDDRDVAGAQLRTVPGNNDLRAERLLRNGRRARRGRRRRHQVQVDAEWDRVLAASRSAGSAVLK